VQKEIQPLFESRSTVDELDAVCATLPIDFVVAKDTDAVWGSLDNWVWHRRPLFGNRFVRIFQCALPVSKPLR
jgi:hypothetical protein